MWDELTTETYINPQIIARGSAVMLSKLQDDEPLFFTVSSVDFKNLFRWSEKKDSGHLFEGCEAYFIPNSYLEIHVGSISILSDRVALQFRKRRDGRGLNIFVSESDNEISHELTFDTLPDKEDFFNELHLKTKVYHNDFYLSVSLINR
jgi:hypothetical protein